ncbi:mitochondrion organization and biogenesis protein [Coccidioides immitis RS]|nr:mitochondrion organization and biogenesis protein [Coccidioides immitis RS]EAS34194.3 mitochondrion organization and biogenesis protein [Coccidioides immitis RS]
MFGITSRPYHRWSSFAQALRILQSGTTLALELDHSSLFFSKRNITSCCHHTKPASHTPTSSNSIWTPSPLAESRLRSGYSLKPAHTNRVVTRRYASTTPKDSQPDPQAKTVSKRPAKKMEQWRLQKEALKKKFQEGWAPPKRLSPDAIEGVRELHQQNPQKFSTAVLAEHFKMSPEAIRRILKSKWRPSEKEMEKRRERWERRETRIWDHMSELGLRPLRKRPSSPASDKSSDAETRNRQP